jgi:hypothetical protein
MHTTVNSNTKSFFFPNCAQDRNVLHLLHAHKSWYLTLCQTFYNKDWLIFEIAVSVQSLNLFRGVGIGRRWALTFTKPHRRGARSGDCRGQDLDSTCQINRSANCLFKNVVNSLWICGSTLSYWKRISSLCWSSWVINQNSNIPL